MGKVCVCVWLEERVVVRDAGVDKLFVSVDSSEPDLELEGSCEILNVLDTLLERLIVSSSVGVCEAVSDGDSVPVSVFVLLRSSDDEMDAEGSFDSDWDALNVLLIDSDVDACCESENDADKLHDDDSDVDTVKVGVEESVTEDD